MINLKQKLYSPFTNKKYIAYPGLVPLLLDNEEKNNVFQIDNKYFDYLKNKDNCRNENINKYYLRLDEDQLTLKVISQFILDNLVNTYPNYFNKNKESDNNKLYCKLTKEIILFDDDFNLIENNRYNSFIDAIVSQIQEDISIWQLNDNNDWLSTLHICSPNNWNPKSKIGQNFSIVHKPVPGMEDKRVNYRYMINNIIKKGHFTRFIWDISSECHLNNHPDNENPYVVKYNDISKDLFIRIEKQNLLSFPEVKAFLFTIRTFFYNLEEYNSEELNLLKKNFLETTLDKLLYKGLNNYSKNILNKFDLLIDKKLNEK